MKEMGMYLELVNLATGGDVDPRRRAVIANLAKN